MVVKSKPTVGVCSGFCKKGSYCVLPFCSWIAALEKWLLKRIIQTILARPYVEYTHIFCFTQEDLFQLNLYTENSCSVIIPKVALDYIGQVLASTNWY